MSAERRVREAPKKRGLWTVSPTRGGTMAAGHHQTSITCMIPGPWKVLRGYLIQYLREQMNEQMTSLGNTHANIRP